MHHDAGDAFLAAASMVVVGTAVPAVVVAVGLTEAFHRVSTRGRHADD